MSGKVQGSRHIVVSGLVWSLVFWIGFSATAASVEIKVVEKESPTRGVSDAKVDAYSGSNGAPFFSAKTSADGTAQIDLKEPGANLRIAVAKPGWCPLRWDLTTDDLAAKKTLTFRMTPAVTIGGVVRDERGKPVSGASITVNFPQSLSGARTPVDDMAVVSDAQGRWQADYVAAGAAYIRVEPALASYKWDEQQPSREDLLAGRAVLNMRGGHTIAGRVLGPDGHPVAGATVFRGGQYGIMGRNSRTEQTMTDAEGRFQFQSDDSGEIHAEGGFQFRLGDGGGIQLAAIADGFGPVIASFNADDNAGPIDLTLTPPHVLRVRVTDLDGHPLAGLSVRTSDWKSFRYPPWNFTTDADGRFVFTNAPADRVSMDFFAAGKMSMIMYPLMPGDEEHVVKLGPALRVHGRVLDAATGKPIASFSITPGFPREIIQNGVLTNSGGEFPALRQDRHFHDGKYDWTFGQPQVVGGQEPASIILRAQADGYGPQVSRVFGAREADAEFDFQLKAPTYLNGIALLPDGSPAAGARIYLADELWNLEAVNGVPQPGPAGTMVMETADDQGKFKLIEAEAPPNLLVWHEAGFAQLETSDLHSNSEIKLTRWARIEGTLKRGQAIAANEQVALWYPEQYIISPRQTSQKSIAFYRYNTRTDANGHFAFDNVAPGEVGIARVEDISDKVGIGMPIQTVRGGCRLMVIRIAEGATTNVEVGGFGRTVTGRFISTNRFDSCLASLDVELPPLPSFPGMDVAARKKMAEDWFWSDAGAPWRIWFGGTPQPTARSGLFGPSFFGANGGATQSWAVKVERDGSFRIDDVPAGDYTVTAVFYQPRQLGDNFAQPVEIARLSHKFSVLATNDLPALPPLDLGEIKGKAATGPSARLNFNVPAPTPNEPVKAGIGPDRERVRAGDSFELAVLVRIAGGYHIYATNAAGSPFKPATLELTLPEGIQADGDWVRPEAIRARDGGMIYSDAVCFRRPLKVKPGASASHFVIHAKLQYQACNSDLCFPPAAIELEAPITVASAATGENP